MIIRAARVEDAGRLTMVAHAAKRHWGYREEWIVRWKSSFTVDGDYVLRNPVFVAVRNGEAVGFYALRRSGFYCELDHFWVDPESMGRGVGRALFRHAVVQRDLLYPGMPLEIESDPNAEAFYLKMGATREGAITRSWNGVIRTLPRLLVREDAAVSRFTKPQSSP